ncbi:MAG: hypothetical protein JWL59_1435 [Chthoniobacteraceae bacterium]|nr:hypothetical protein [Chthoniobacteraceae bacterium]
MFTKLLPLLVFGVSVITSGAAVRAEPMLVGHPGLRGQRLDDDGVKAVLLGKKVTLSGARVVVIFARQGVAQNAFLSSHLGMTTTQFQNYWRRLFMTGGGSAPRIVETEAEARKLAAEIPGAVVVIDSADAGGFTVLAAD